MAASLLIPIAQTVAPLVLPYVAKLMDRIFGSHTGDVKLSVGTQVSQLIMAELQKLIGPGVALPTDSNEIKQTLQSVVNDLNSKGLLNGVNTVVDPLPVIVSKNNSYLASLLLDAASALLKKP